MEFAEAMEKIKELGEDVSSAVLGKISSLNEEAKTHRETFQGFKKEVFENLKDFGFQETEKIDSFAKRLSSEFAGLKESRESGKTELEKLSDRLKTLETERDQAIEEGKKAKADSLKKEIDNNLMESLGLLVDEKNVSVLKKALFDNVKTSENGIFFEHDGKQFGTIKEGVEAWVESNKHFKKIVQKQGSGGGSVGSGSDSAEFSVKRSLSDVVKKAQEKTN